MKRGHTLLELTIVLSLVGLLLAFAIPVMRAQVDLLAVRAAREEVAGILREARAAARLHGGSRVVVAGGGAVELVVREDSVIRRYDPREHRVRVESRGSREGAELRYGPTGVGRVASLTLDFHRGGVSRPLVVSSYGRVRREG